MKVYVTTLPLDGTLYSLKNLVAVNLNQCAASSAVNNLSASALYSLSSVSTIKVSPACLLLVPLNLSACSNIMMIPNDGGSWWIQHRWVY